MRKNGFTLSEMMIAVLIIGIIAALTIPAAITKSQNKGMLLEIKKNFKELTDNVNIFAMENYNKKFENTILGKGPISGFLGSSYYNVKTDCSVSGNKCFAEKYRSLDALKTFVSFSCDNAVVVKGGAAVCIVPDSTRSTVYIDVNGTEKPNIGGRDMFKFYIYSDYYVGDKEDLEDAQATCKASTVGEGCLQDIIDNDWQMKY